MHKRCSTTESTEKAALARLNAQYAGEDDDELGAWLASINAQHASEDDDDRLGAWLASISTKRFLCALDADSGQFTFQTFDDNSDRNNKALARVLHGTFEQHVGTLRRLNARGAGVFVTVNETDGKGRTRGNIRRVRAVFVDLDVVPLQPGIMEQHVASYCRREFS